MQVSKRWWASALSAAVGLLVGTVLFLAPPAGAATASPNRAAGEIVTSLAGAAGENDIALPRHVNNHLARSLHRGSSDGVDAPRRVPTPAAPTATRSVAASGALTNGVVAAAPARAPPAAALA